MAEGFWTEARVRQLVALWEAGRSCSEIARLFAQEGGVTVTKNMVTGKARRLKLPFRPSPIHPKASKPKQSETRKQLVGVPARKGLLPASAICTFTTCQWPIGDPAAPDFHFCGVPVRQRGKPYCDVHQARAVDRQATEEAKARDGGKPLRDARTRRMRVPFADAGER